MSWHCASSFCHEEVCSPVQGPVQSDRPVFGLDPEARTCPKLAPVGEGFFLGTLLLTFFGVFWPQLEFWNPSPFLFCYLLVSTRILETFSVPLRISSCLNPESGTHLPASLAMGTMNPISTKKGDKTKSCPGLAPVGTYFMPSVRRSLFTKQALSHYFSRHTCSPVMARKAECGRVSCVAL